MSIAVPLDELAVAITGWGPIAYLVTIGEVGPRVVSVTVELVAGGANEQPPAALLLCVVGRHTAENAAARPAVTLFWPTDAEHPKHTLLVDGTAFVNADGERLDIRPTGAMLHRVRAGRGAVA